VSVTDELFEKQEDCPVELDENDDTYDECFELLSNYRRRCTLHYLEQHEETASVSSSSTHTVVRDYFQRWVPLSAISRAETPNTRLVVSVAHTYLARTEMRLGAGEPPNTRK
jgi:hypothetical protein